MSAFKVHACYKKENYALNVREISTDQKEYCLQIKL